MNPAVPILFCLAAALAPAVAGEGRPNVLFIAVDDMRCELGCYGTKHVLTPNLDRFADSGVLFTRAYCQQAVCNPSRASLMTGLRPDTTKVWDLVTDFRTTIPNAVTIPQHFRQHGYRAVAYGKIYHNTFPDAPSWDEPTHNATDVIAYSADNRRRLAEFKKQMEADGKKAPAIGRMRGPATEIQEQPDEMNFDGKQTGDAIGKMRELAAGGAPFFLAVGYIRPHLPFITPRKYWDLYDRAKIPLATNGFLPRGAPTVAFGDRSLGGFYELRDYMDYANAPSPFERPLAEAQQRELKHGYYASVSFIDAQVGRLLGELDRLGLAQNTIVVLWSDHGWKLGEHGGWCKQTNYEIDTRAPLIIRAPGKKGNGQPSRALVEFVDIYPTLCELAGLPAPPALEGTSLAPLLGNPAAKVKDAAFSQFPRRHEGRDYMGYAMRTERYRYVEWLDKESGAIAARELYDHENDADENENIAGRPEHADLIARLNKQMWTALPKPGSGSAATGARETRTIRGWTLHINRQLLERDPKPTERAVELLERQLAEIIRVLPPAAVARLQEVPLYFSPEYPDKRAGAAYHPDPGWLREHERDPAMARGVEFTNIRKFEAETRRMPNFALHELAHAYHHRVLPDGFGNSDIKAAYKRAKAGGGYDRVERQDSEGRKRMDRAYALTNPQEYFAETTEAYFSRNDFFPYDKDQLQAHDPEMFALLGKLWGVAANSDGAGPRSAAGRPPNILFILADDLGYGDVGCYNPESKVPTPHLDRLAREGMRFTDAHSPSTVCTPARYSLLTGQMAFRINYRGVFTGVGGPCLIKEDQLTLPQMLRERGYATALTGKWHVGLSFPDRDGKRITQGGVEGVNRIDYARPIPDAPVHRGFDRFFGTACCPTTDFLYAFIDGDRIPVPPTALLDKSKLPKHPYSLDNRAGMIAPDFDLEQVDLVFLKKSLAFLEEHRKARPGQPFFLLHSMQAAHLPSFPAPQFRGRTKAGPHGDFIHELDHIVGELMTALEKLGAADDTLVMFSSDNGPETTSVIRMRADHGHDGARPWRGLKRDQWEGGHRVPFIVRWPGKVAPGSTSTQTVCLTDVMATCAAAAGATLPDNAAEDSVNLLPVLLGQDGGKPVREFTLHQTISLALAIRQGPWKYLDHPGSGGNDYNSPSLKPLALTEKAPAAPGQLYNLETDPGETRNLYFERPEIVQKLKALLDSSKTGGTRAAAPVPNRTNPAE